MSGSEDSDIDLPQNQPVSTGNDEDELQDAQVIRADEDLPSDPDLLFNDTEDVRSRHTTNGSSDQELRTSTSSNITTTARIIPSVIRNPFAEETSYFTRPNRYFGPASTWRMWTEQDRMVVQSLDRIRSQDLSVHLFGAFVLKQQQSQEQDRCAKDESTGRGRPRQRARSDSGTRSNELIIPRSWTAWPIPPNEVPRDDYLTLPSDLCAIRKSADVRPSSQLEDALIATITRTARERWQRRSWETESEGEGNVGKIKADDPRSKSRSAESDSSTHDRALNNESGRSVHEQLFTSQAYDSSSSVSDEEQQKEESRNLSGDDSDAYTEQRPHPLADDDAARDLLLPTTRHILSKLDDLLLGLHKARQAYSVPTQKSRGDTDGDETGTETDVTTSRSRSRKSSRAGKPISGQASGSRKRKRSDSIMSTSSTGSHTSQASSARRNKKFRNPGLRDWSDIVGMAALTGWDSEVVQRASQRCAKIFSQNMRFRTFHEGEKGAEKSKSHFTNHDAVPTGRDNSARNNDQGVSKAPPHAVRMIPQTTQEEVARVSQACQTCQKMKIRCEPVGAQNSGSVEVGSLNRQVSALQIQIPGAMNQKQTCKACLENRKPCSGIVVRQLSSMNPRMNSRYCPYPHCNRHVEPFTKSSHLKRHLQAVHGRNESSGPLSSPLRPSLSLHPNSSLNPVSSPLRSLGTQQPPISKRSASAGSLPLPQFLTDGPAGQGIICPVLSCVRHEQGFNVTGQLYDHLRKYHPHIDVNEVKRLMADRRRQTRNSQRMKKSQTYEQHNSGTEVNSKTHLGIDENSDPDMDRPTAAEQNAASRQTQFSNNTPHRRRVRHQDSGWLHGLSDGSEDEYVDDSRQSHHRGRGRTRGAEAEVAEGVSPHHLMRLRSRSQSLSAAIGGDHNNNSPSKRRVSKTTDYMDDGIDNNDDNDDDDDDSMLLDDEPSHDDQILDSGGGFNSRGPGDDDEEEEDTKDLEQDSSNNSQLAEVEVDDLETDGEPDYDNDDDSNEDDDSEEDNGSNDQAIAKKEASNLNLDDNLYDDDDDDDEEAEEITKVNSDDSNNDSVNVRNDSDVEDSDNNAHESNESNDNDHDDDDDDNGDEDDEQGSIDLSATTPSRPAFQN